MKDDRTPIAVVTGASAGVGRATAHLLAERGYDVGLIARGRAGLDGARKGIERHGRRALAVQADVAFHEEVDIAAGKIESELGPIDVWVNNAMTTVFQRVVDTAPADFARAVEVTFLGQVWGTMAALARMRPRDSGTIVNVGSALAFLGIPLQAPYCASKFACRGFFESLRAELIEEQSNVQLRMVHLPAVNTPQFDWCQTTFDRQPQPVPPIYEPEQAAGAIVNAISSDTPSRPFGSWNRLVVGAARYTPELAVQFAAATGRESQLEDEPIPPDRPTNLYAPVDDTVDHGARGRFDNRAGGALQPAFLKGLPHTFREFVRAARAAWF